MTQRGPSLSFVLLPTSTMPTAEAFGLAWREVMSGRPQPIEKAWSAESAELEQDGVVTIASWMPVPVPNQEAEAAASRSLCAMRPEGFSPAPHVTHLVVASTAPTGSPVERLLRHTRVVAALAKAGNATGVYEGKAGATHDPAFYVDVVANGPELPLMLWNGISIAKSADTVELLTLGMSQLQFPDLLLVAPHGQANDGIAFAFDLLGYVIERGQPLPEGETVGRTAKEKLPVTYVPSPIDPAARVMRVELPQAKKRWWHFGGD